MAKKKTKSTRETELKKTFKKQILRFGKWSHKKAPDGVLNITKDFVNKVVKNFKKSPFAPITRGHVSEGELEKNPTLILNKNISGLEADDKGLNAIMEVDTKELDKYNDVSVSLDLEGEDHETGDKIGPVLRHVAMVTNPYIKGLEAFIPLRDVKSNLLINLSDIQDMEDKKKVEVEEETKAGEVEETPKVEEEKPTETPSKESEEEVEEKPGEKEDEPSEDPKEEPKTEPEEPKADLAEPSQLQEKIVELEEQVVKQSRQLALQAAEADYSKLLKAGKITPAQKDIYMNLCAVSSSTVELSDGTKTDVKTLVNDLFNKAPRILNFEETSVDIESAEKEEKLKVELRERRSDLSDKEFEALWEKHGKTAKAYANV